VAHGLHTLIVRYGANQLVTLLFGPSYDLRDAGSQRLTFADISPGDHIRGQGTPDPTKALYFTVFGLHDSSVKSVSKAKARLTSVAPDQTSANATIGTNQVLIDLGKGTTIRLPGGTSGTLSDLLSDQTVEVSGIYNATTHTFVRATSIRILSSPRVKLGLSITHAAVAQGENQSLAVTGLPSSTVTIEVSYPIGKATRTSLKTNKSGKLLYSFKVPTNVNTYASTTAHIVVASSGAAVNKTFQVKRDVLNLYPFHRTVKIGAVEPVRLIGPASASVDLIVLLPDGHFASQRLHLDAHGRGSYDLHVPVLGPHKSTSVDLLATTTVHGKTYAAKASFGVK